MEGLTRDQVERVARLYANNQEASLALGVTSRSFSRACRRYGIETPYVRRHGRQQRGGALPATR